MAKNYTQQIDDVTDSVVSLIDQAQEAATSVVSTVSGAVAEFVPELGLGELLLSPADAVESSYRVSNKFMDAGRRSALGLLEAVSPVTDKIFGSKRSAVKAAPKSA
jgi:phage-related protein